MLAEGVSHKDVLRDFPYLEPDDIKAALAYAARQADHAVLQRPTIQSFGNTRARPTPTLRSSKDEDFVDRWLLDPAPVSLLWIRRGNCSSRALMAWLQPLWPDTLKRLEQGERLVELRG